MPGNLYDGHTLKECLPQTQRITKAAPVEVYTDRGYKGHGCPEGELKVWIAGTRRGSDAQKAQAQKCGGAGHRAYEV